MELNWDVLRLNNMLISDSNILFLLLAFLLKHDRQYFAAQFSRIISVQKYCITKGIRIIFLTFYFVIKKNVVDSLCSMRPVLRFMIIMVIVEELILP